MYIYNLIVIYPVNIGMAKFPSKEMRINTHY